MVRASSASAGEHNTDAREVLNREAVTRKSCTVPTMLPSWSGLATQMPFGPASSTSTGGKESGQTRVDWAGGLSTVRPGPAPSRVIPSLAMRRFS